MFADRIMDGKLANSTRRESTNELFLGLHAVLAETQSQRRLRLYWTLEACAEGRVAQTA